MDVEQDKISTTDYSKTSESTATTSDLQLSTLKLATEPYSWCHVYLCITRYEKTYRDEVLRAPCFISRLFPHAIISSAASLSP